MTGHVVGSHRRHAVQQLVGLTLGVLMLIALIALIVTMAPARAATPVAPAAITVSGSAQGSQVTLSATLSTPGHRPLAKATVQFFQRTTEFGPKGRLVPIGTASTDKTGVATLRYRSTVSGRQNFVARYAGGPAAGAASAGASVHVLRAHAVYRPAPRKTLAVAGQVTVLTLLAIVVAVWVALVAQIVRVRRVLAEPRP